MAPRVDVRPPPQTPPPPRQRSEHPALYNLGHNGEAADNGALRFPGSRRAPSRWAKLAPSATPSNVWPLLVSAWNTVEPGSIITIIGPDGVDEQFVDLEPGKTALPDYDMLVFRRGLADAALKTQGWILSNGTLGVGTVAGRAVTEVPDVTCIGVLPWGGNGKPGPGDKISSLSRRNGRVQTYEQGESTASSARLDPNHTHFLMVGDEEASEKPPTAPLHPLPPTATRNAAAPQIAPSPQIASPSRAMPSGSSIKAPSAPSAGGEEDAAARAIQSAFLSKRVAHAADEAEVLMTLEAQETQEEEAAARAIQARWASKQEVRAALVDMELRATDEPRGGRPPRAVNFAPSTTSSLTSFPPSVIGNAPTLDCTRASSSSTAHGG